MQIGIVAPGRDVRDWSRAFSRYTGTEVQVWPDIKQPDEVELAIAWNPPSGVLATFPNLKLISSLGAGVDHIIKDQNLPAVPVVRIVDENLSRDMSHYILMAIFNHQRGTYRHFLNQKIRHWDTSKQVINDLPIGILGLGVLGKAVAEVLVYHGFEVHGFSKSPKHIEGIVSHFGTEGLQNMMSQVEVLINLLPLTDETRGILSKPLFSMSQKPFYLINVARGGHLVVGDLIEALEDGMVNGACLDVFEQEPLPSDHPLWDHPKVIITPHVASITNPHTVVAQILDNFERVKQGKTLLNQIDLQHGY